MSQLRSIKLLRAAASAGCIAVLAACASTSTAPMPEPAAPPSQAQAPAAIATAAPDSARTTESSAAPATSAVAQAPLPARAIADFDRAVNAMRGGNAGEAEIEFKQLGEAYPQLAAPYVNLGLLYRKAGKLDQSEEALSSATERNAASAVAWNELGVTRRMRGRFHEAGEAYQHAIAADDTFAPAHRNYGVLLDLYLSEPEQALGEFERYQELTGEEKPVSSWIAELRQRTGKKVPVPPAREHAQDAPPAAPSESTTPPEKETPAQPPPSAKGSSS